MYTSFTVRNFRCFGELTISSLERINLIAGKNNVGKTALLEAMFLHAGAYNPSLALNVNAFRGIESVKVEIAREAEAPWGSVFNKFDTSKPIELVGEDTATGHRLLRLRALSKPEELEKIPESLKYDREGPGKALGTIEFAQVLELEYEEAGRRGSYYMIIDRKGPRIDPVPPPPPFPGFFQGARMRIRFEDEAERYGKLEIHSKQDVLLRVLKLIEPRLRRIALVVFAGVPILHGDVGMGRLIPLPVSGEGMARLTSLVLSIANAENGVVFVDEIENGLHHSVMSKVWSAVGEAAREFNAQLFATTHSMECVKAAHNSFSEGKLYDFRLHRLDRINDSTRVKTYDREALGAAIETGLEVR